MITLQQLQRVLGGKIYGNVLRAPGPGHSKDDDSMAIWSDPRAPHGIRVFSHAGNDWELCTDYIVSKAGLPPWEPRRTPRAPIAHPAPPVSQASDNRARIQNAVSIFREGLPIEGTPVTRYFERRGVDASKLPGLHHALRWHPACPWEQGRHGAMVALMTDAITGEPRAIHRTAISGAGEKVGKKMLGPAGGCLVRMWPDDAITSGLVLGEGIETTLVAATRIEHRGTRLAPAWAACSAGGMAKFPVLAGVESLTLLVDHDESGTGERAALECSERWTAAGREVIRLTPNIAGQDFADLAGAA